LRQFAGGQAIAAGVLQGPGSIPADLEQVVSRTSGLRHVGRLRLFVSRLKGFATSEVVQELGPGRVRLANEHRVAEVREKILLDGNQRPADDGKDRQIAQADEYFTNPRLLDVHPRDADDIVAAERIPVDFFHVLVEQAHGVISAKPRQRGQRSRNHGAAFVAGINRQGILKTPVRRLESGVNQTDGQRSSRGARRAVTRKQRFDGKHRRSP